MSLKANTFDYVMSNPPFGLNASHLSWGPWFEEFTKDLTPAPKGKKFKYSPTLSGMALGGVKKESGEWEVKPPGKIDILLLMIDRALQVCAPGGTIGLIVPDGFLSNQREQFAREYLMGRKGKEEGKNEVRAKAKIRAVVSLPSETFKEHGTTIKTSIFIFEKNRPETQESDIPAVIKEDYQVFMAVIEKNSEIPEVKTEWSQFEEDPSVFA